MKTDKFRRLAIAAGAIALAAAGAAIAADYNSAKAAGQIGEKMDGYVAVVGSGSAELRKIVDDINIKRKAVYAEKAQAQHATVEEYAFTSGCLLIAKTKPGEKYQAPDGSWQTRTSAPPLRDARCP
ncbi:MAG: YdbL family protein [Novosphingobium sp.]|nr:YdbL family protein [Novosphingobium sp.]MCB2084753.1 YdbL family protein [Sphingomonadaceae bacterium]MCP5403075.1 YdbL family protein [Novosphingobium sp.]